MPDKPAIDVDWDNWTAQMRTMLVFIKREDEVLLIRKKRGLGAGKINGPGGKLDDGETLEQAAVRETEEEVGLTPKDLKNHGELYFQFADGLSIHCTVFVSELFEGTLTETDEALPMWVKTDEIPFDQMWEDDQYWLSQVLAGDTFEGYFTFDDDKMLSRHLTFGSGEVDTDLPEEGEEAAAAEDAAAEDQNLSEEDETASEEDETASEEEETASEEEVGPAHDLDDETFLYLQRIVESLIMASESPMTARALLGTLRKVEADHVAMAKEAEKEGEPYTGPDLTWVNQLEDGAILAAIEALNESYDREERAFAIAERASGYKIFTRPRYGLWVRGLFPDQKPQRLRPPALETLAIIAYRQPLTKAGIEAVRGVSVDGVIKMLLDRSLIQIGGRAEAPGRPLLYETTDVFLDHFGIRTVDELPNAEELRQVKLPTAEEEQPAESKEEAADAEEEPIEGEAAEREAAEGEAVEPENGEEPAEEIEEAADAEPEAGKVEVAAVSESEVGDTDSVEEDTEGEK